MLTNQAHQRFVEAYVASGSARSAYREAYPHADAADCQRNASRLLRRSDVQNELQRIQTIPLQERITERVVERCAVGPVETIRELAAIAFSDVGDLVEEPTEDEPDVMRMVHLKRLPNQIRRAISYVKVRREKTKTERFMEAGVQVTRTSTSDVVEYRLWSKVDALRAIGQHLGLFQDLPPLDVLLAHVAAEHGQAAADLLRQALTSAVKAGIAGPGHPSPQQANPPATPTSASASAPASPSPSNPSQPLQPYPVASTAPAEPGGTATSSGPPQDEENDGEGEAGTAAFRQRPSGTSPSHPRHVPRHGHT